MKRIRERVTAEHRAVLIGPKATKNQHGTPSAYQDHWDIAPLAKRQTKAGKGTCFLTFFAIDMIQEVDRVFHYTVTDITIIPGTNKTQRSVVK